MSQVQSQSRSQCQSSVNLYHYGTEVIVNFSPDTVVQVKINEAEFIVKGKEILSVQKPEYSSKLYSAAICEQEVITEPIEKLNFEYIDEVKVRERELIQETVKYQGIINTENISPPPYAADEIFEYTDDPPEYFASYLPPPEYFPNPEIKLKPLKKFKTRYFLPNYIEARMETGISEEEYNELFGGPVGEYDYDPVISAQEENWERSNREFERKEYYNPNINFGVRDSVLRENGNIYEPQVNEIIDDIINNHGGVCSCGCGKVYQSRD